MTFRTAFDLVMRWLLLPLLVLYLLGCFLFAGSKACLEVIREVTSTTT